MNLGKLNLEERYVRLRGCELQPVRGDLLCDSFVARDSFLQMIEGPAPVVGDCLSGQSGLYPEADQVRSRRGQDRFLD